MRRCSLFKQMALLVFVFLLCGCSVNPEMLHERNALKYSVIQTHDFQACRHAIDGAYKHFTYLQMHCLHSTTYADWSKLNNMLASALSARTKQCYDQCVYRAMAVDDYLNREMAFMKWRDGFHV
jgi:hypothetical protein